MEFDLSSVLRLRDDPFATAALELDYASNVQYYFNFPSFVKNKSGVLGNTLYFNSYNGFGGNIVQSDGTLAGTHPVSSVLFQYSDDYRKVGNHLYFVSQNKIWLINGEGALPTQIAIGFSHLGEVIEIGTSVYFTSDGLLYSMEP